MMAAQHNNSFNDSAASTVIVGLGKTGLSCARFFMQQQQSFVVTDTRADPPSLEELKNIAPGVDCFLGEFDPQVFKKAKTLVVSPGVSIKEPMIAQAIARGVEIKGDIALFAEHADAPFIAITGSNGKSTVTTLLGEMARNAGMRVKVGGNLGTPALDLLLDTDPGAVTPDFYVLEISSFQLETTENLNAFAAVVLNVSADHMDRYASLDEYVAAKKTVYNNARYKLVNRDDPLVAKMVVADKAENLRTFGLGEPQTENDFGLQNRDGQQWLVKGSHALLPASSISLPGKHNCLNAMAALALGELMQIPLPAMLSVLQSFTGLPHRMQLVATRHDVQWYNDSKGTNVGATVSAIQGMQGSKIVIAGGEAKDADFTPLRNAIVENDVKMVILIGKDAATIEKAIIDTVDIEHADNLYAAVMLADKNARPNDKVILSPACASFDMFRNFEHRGEVFMEAVRSLPI